MSGKKHKFEAKVKSPKGGNAGKAVRARLSHHSFQMNSF